MLTINPGLTASRVFEQNFAPIHLRETACGGEPSHYWNAQYSSRYVSMSEDTENWRVRPVENTPSAASFMFPLNAPYVSTHGGQRATRLCDPAGNANSSQVFLAITGQLHALLAFYTDERFAPILAVEDTVTSPSLPPVIEAELSEFSSGIGGGLCPTTEAVRIARMLSEAAVRHVTYPGITVDIDGELSFDLRLQDGRLVFAELDLNAQIDVGVYGPDDQMLEHNTEATCEYLLSIIES